MNSEPLSIHIPCGENLGKRINEVIINDDSFIDRILKSIEYSYKKSKLFSQEWEFVQSVFLNCMADGNSLDAIDIKIIREINSYLELPVKIYLSSFDHQSAVLKRTERIIAASEALCDKELLLGDGKSLEVHDLELLKKANIKIYRLNYFTEHPTYFQCRRQKAPFLKCMSVVDTLLNVGKEETIKLLSKVQPESINY